MSADSLDPYPYVPASGHSSEARRRHYWAVAIGLQDVDGLSVSAYLSQEAQSYIRGEKSMAEVGELIRSRHASGEDAESEQADLVSQRIAELLERGAFCLAPEFLAQIHAYLFQDLDAETFRPGEFKRERMVKQEEILNGDSVLYADPMTYDMSLRAAFNVEVARTYATLAGSELAAFCHTIAFLWQVHPFLEGNTRTVAVFSELYLNSLGFSVTNEPFERHARYYRDALVRAMYQNVPAGVTYDESFLVKFYENVIGWKDNPLKREDLLAAPLFDHPELLKNIDPREALCRQGMVI